MFKNKEKGRTSPNRIKQTKTKGQFKLQKKTQELSFRMNQTREI